MKYLSLFTLMFMISCVDQPIAVLESKDACDTDERGSKQALYRSMSAMIKVDCEDLTQYKCDVREFSPSLADGVEKNIEYCPDQSLDCLKYDHQVFDTSNHKRVDEYSTENDFELGGQYNRKEVTCWNKFEKNRAPASDQSNIRDALKVAYENCQQ